MLDTATQEETVYEYDLYGNLLSVMLPDGRTIEYDVDGAGRRVGRRVLDAQGVEQEYRGWIYRDLLRPIAEVDAAGNVTARYVYLDGEGSKQNGMHQLATRLGANQDTSLPFDDRRKIRSEHAAHRTSPWSVVMPSPAIKRLTRARGVQQVPEGLPRGRGWHAIC